jgi:ankyrin repeat protein
MRSIPVVAAAIILAVGLASAPVAAGPIHDAALTGDVAELKKLLASGVKVDARDERGNTPLHWAQTEEIAKVLLKAGAKVYVRDEYGCTPLHYAKTAEIAEVLLSAGAPVGAWDKYGYSPLHEAAVSGRADVVEFLLSAGANPKAKNRGGETPFDLVRGSSTLKGTDAYWLLNEAQYK